MNKEMMQDSGVEWIGAIPQGWKRHRIKDVTELSPTYSANKPDSEMLCTVIPMECVSEKGIVDTSNVDKYVNVSKGLTFFEKGDVIFAKITPCMENGKGAYIENLPTKYAFGSTEFHVLRTDCKLNGKFLYYYTFNDGFRDYAAVNMTGAAGQKRVSTNFLKYTPIYLPDLLEQQAIARYLDQRCGKLDAVIAIKQQQIKTLDALRQSIIYHAVTKGLDDSVPLVDSGVEWLGKIPQNWKVTKAKYVSEIFVPQRNKPLMNDEFGCYWVTMENMGNPIISKTDKLISNEAQKEAGSKILPKHSVIASCVGTFGIASVNEVVVIINQQLQAYIPENINPHYLRYLISNI
jgi:restriction endonuclease S subunit